MEYQPSTAMRLNRCGTHRPRWLSLISSQNWGGVFGSYGWTGEAVKMVQDRLRGLKLRVPIPGIRIKLIPTEEEIQLCREFGHEMAKQSTGLRQAKVIDMADLA